MNNDENTLTIKKKILEEEIKIPKKRGRKPKNKPVEVKIPKKRGRKPTGKILSLAKGEITKIENDEDCIIAHIPLQDTDIEKFSKKSTSKSYNDTSDSDNCNDSNFQRRLEMVKDQFRRLKPAKFIFHQFSTSNS